MSTVAEPQYLTVREVADSLRVSPSTIRRALDRGDIRAVRFAGTVRVPTAELERLATTTKETP